MNSISAISISNYFIVCTINNKYYAIVKNYKNELVLVDIYDFNKYHDILLLVGNCDPSFDDKLEGYKYIYSNIYEIKKNNWK